MAYAGHVLMENRSGLVAHSCLTHATGMAERDAALQLVDRLAARHRITLGADKGYDVAGFIAALRQRRVTPHVAVDGRVSKLGLRRGSGIDGRTLRRPGYAASQRVRKRIEAVFGWIKSSARLRQTEHRGRERVGWRFDLAATAYNLIRLPKLLATAPT
jgi:IS5 family transposase